MPTIGSSPTPAANRKRVEPHNVSRWALAEQDISEGAERTASVADSFMSVVAFGGDPRTTELQRVVSSLSGDVSTAGKIQKKVKTKRRLLTAAKIGTYAASALLAGGTVALIAAAAPTVGVGVCLAMAAGGGLGSLGALMNARETGAELQKVKRVEKKLPGLMERTAARLSSPVLTPKTQEPLVHSSSDGKVKVLQSANGVLTVI